MHARIVGLSFVSACSVLAAAPALAATTSPQRPIPIAVDDDALVLCGWPAAPAGRSCAVYDGTGEPGFGESEMTLINLDRWGVAGDGACVDAGATSLQEWLAYGAPTLLRTGVPPDELRHVCRHRGSTPFLFGDLAALIGSRQIVVVNACADQVDEQGLRAPCPLEPDKVVGMSFELLRVDAVFRGDDPAAIGTPATETEPGVPGACGLRPADPSATCTVFSITNGLVRLTIRVRGPGRGVVRAGHGTRCRAADGRCVFRVTWAEALRLRAEASTRSRFAGWSGRCGSTPTCTLPMRGPTLAVARFQRT